VIMPILDTWESRPSLEFPNYAAGMWGPENAEALIARSGHAWAFSPIANGHEPVEKEKEKAPAV